MTVRRRINPLRSSRATRTTRAARPAESALAGPGAMTRVVSSRFESQLRVGA
ncbi:hypothetical protein KCH_26210 [Kitasatospora cheerisanensis KCTC 2395]|uniref:Uncharacterized protein n=1 Tax=Kitasatospora cheerisanensis KCTC 2395 TaxID=1348663 RepID=A0A066Z033_9ACTN|nr:hypothetical protein KCH_26210 [Kitasatospora cheerisanensis KCTC 2395]